LNWDNEDGNKEAFPIPSCKGGAGAAPWGAREASPIPSCKGGAGAAPWGARKASPIPSFEGGANGIIFLLMYYIVTMLIKIRAKTCYFRSEASAEK